MNQGKQAYVVILYLFVYIESIYNASVIKKEHYFFCNFKKIHYYNLKLTNNTKTVLKSLLQPHQPSAQPVCNHHKDKQQRQLPKKKTNQLGIGMKENKAQKNHSKILPQNHSEF